MVKSKVLRDLRKRVDKANKIADPLGKLGALSPPPPLPAQIRYLSKLSPQKLVQAYDLFEKNMGDLYKSSSWGLKKEEKIAELTHPLAKFLWVEEDTSNVDNVKDAPLRAFVHFRFCMDDDEVPSCVCLYVYEIQVASTSSRQGLGRNLMQCCEQMARDARMDKVILTTFKSNKNAMQFYQNLSYTVDETSPSQHQQPADYEILSKAINHINSR